MNPTSQIRHDTPAQGAGLKCRGISARYNRITVVEGVDFDLHGGEMLAVLGPNGSGKSSLLGAIAGVVNGSGQIQLDGTDLGGMLAHKRAARGIAFVPERRGNVFPSMTVAENMEIGLRMIAPGERDEQRQFIWSMFPILKDRAAVTAGVLSGGEQQMLAIGMALGRKPRYLVLDEPSQGLAPAVFDILENAFDVLKKRGLALLLAEQNLPFAARTADRYFILSHGEITQVGRKEDLDDPEKIAQAFLG
jgi:branched-chain amino acid transport system ATP-binding protein